jgi:hypothetical protein
MYVKNEQAYAEKRWMKEGFREQATPLLVEVLAEESCRDRILSLLMVRWRNLALGRGST